jgi:sugar lactone lactonase YvrE
MKKILVPLFACVASAISLLAQPVITIQPTNQIVFNGSTVSFNVTASGVGPLTYQWQFDGTNLPNNIITTVAGNGFGAPWSGNYSGDGGPATNASFYFPSGVALDAFGNLYIADTSNNRIRKMDTNGIITTVAGNGSASYSGDGGNATNASLNLVGGLGMNAVAGLGMDNQGNLYIADPGNNRIRKMNGNGIITTVAGNGNNAYSGDGGQATNASLSGPASVAIDGLGNLYIADTGNSCIRKIDTNGIITTVAGGGSIPIMWGPDSLPATSAQLNEPFGIAVDTNGNFFIADTYDKRIEIVDTNGILTVIAGHGMLEGFSGDGGAATNATFTRPKGVAVDPAQNLYILDTLNQRIREVDSNGIIMTVVGNGAGYPNGAFGGDGGVATNASLQNPYSAVFTRSGNMYIADAWNNRIRFIPFGGLPYLGLSNTSLTNNGNYSVVVTDYSGSVTSSIASLTVLVPATINIQPISQTLAVGSNLVLSVSAYGTSPLNYQWFFNGSAVNGQTNSLLALGGATTNQMGNYSVIVTNLYGSATSSVATVNVGYPPTITTQPTNLTVLIGNNMLLTAGVTGSGLLSYQWQLNGTNLPNNIITTVAGKSNSGFSGDYGAATNAALNMPVGITSDSAGNLLIADSYNHRIRKIDTNGIITTVAGKSSAGYTGDGVAATNAALYYPAGITLDASNNIFIADTMNSRVRKVDASGFITTIAGTNSAGSTGDGGLATIAKLNTDRAVVLDASGNLYIADTYNSRVRKVNTNGIITTVAGNGTAGFSGDGGNATSASLNYPFGITTDSSGNLYIADTRNNRIRKVNTNGIISTVAGKGPSYPNSGTYSGDGGSATNAYINNPRGVAIDPVGNFFIADASNNRVRKVDANGIISTVAGKFGYGFSGDGGASTNASLYDPEGIAFDAVGNLLIADSSNERIRKVFLYASYNTLSVYNLNSKDAGNYSLVVTSPFGSVTGSVATVTVLVPPQQFTGRSVSGGLQIQFFGTPNYPYILQSATNLTPPVNWQPVLTNSADGNGNWQFMDTNLNNGQKFYRAVRQ